MKSRVLTVDLNQESEVIGQRSTPLCKETRYVESTPIEMRWIHTIGRADGVGRLRLDSASH